MRLTKLQKIDKELAEIAKQVSFLAINPANVEEEMEKVLANPNYNPQFQYSEFKFDLDYMIKRLNNLKITGDSVIENLFRQKKQVIIKKCLLIKNRGKKDFSDISVKLYGVPDEELVAKAKELLKLKVEKERKIVPSSMVVSQLRRAFKKCGFNWIVKEESIATAANVLQSKKTLLVRKNDVFSKTFVKRLIIHEIGTHVLRAENGRKQPYQLFMIGLPAYLKTEEGLAVLNEDLNGLMTNRVLRNYAARVVAVDMALKGSFSDIYKHLKKYFAKKAAFKLAVRAKRGVADTSKPGGMIKDHVYLQGYYELKKWLEQGGDLKKLYYGKIGLKHVDLLKDIPGLKRPKYLPRF